jgi:hypothetical protein
VTSKSNKLLEMTKDNTGLMKAMIEQIVIISNLLLFVIVKKAERNNKQTIISIAAQ